MKKGKRVYDPHLKKFVYFDQKGMSKTVILDKKTNDKHKLQTRNHKKSPFDSLLTQKQLFDHKEDSRSKIGLNKMSTERYQDIMDSEF